MVILNDQVLKSNGVAPVLTGKLSDVAGLVAAPAAIAVALRVRTTFALLCVHVSLGMLFVGIKTSPLFARTWEQVGQFCSLPWKVWCDP